MIVWKNYRASFAILNLKTTLPPFTFFKYSCLQRLVSSRHIERWNLQCWTTAYCTQQPKFFYRGDCSDKHLRLIEWDLWVFLKVYLLLFSATKNIRDSSSRHIIKDKFISPIVSLELTQCAAELRWSLGINLLPSLDPISVPAKCLGTSNLLLYGWGHIPNAWFNTPEISQVPSPEKNFSR